VLAHETAHVTQRHIAREINAQSKQGLAQAATILAAILIGVAAGGNGSAMEGAIAAAQGDTDAAARRDEVGATLAPDQLAKAKAAVAAWHAKSPLPEANGVTAPNGGWDDAEGITEADRTGLVKKIQSLLAEKGFDPGPADGVEGPKTHDAVKAFQRNLGVAETGKIDPTLVATLTEKNTDSFDGAFFISVLLVGFITASVEALAALLVLAIDRISPPPKPDAEASVRDPDTELRFH